MTHCPPEPPPTRRHCPARQWLAGLACSVLFAACGGGGAEGSTGSSTGGGAPSAVASADVTVLMMGNSHTAAADLPAQLAKLLRVGLGGRSVAVAVAPGGMYLDERIGHAPSMELLRSRPWTAVLLQAQKYSTTGLFTYSTQAAQQLVQAARVQRAVPVMFPEWPRLGVPETEHIYDLHVGIAQMQPACVAPIGQAWDLALQRHPTLRLHHSDGNHAAVPGAFLAALVLYSAITGASPRALPDIDNGVSPAVQAQLREVAADTLAALSARQHCPADAALAE